MYLLHILQIKLLRFGQGEDDAVIINFKASNPQKFK